MTGEDRPNCDIKNGSTCKIKLYKGKANFVPSLELGFKDFLLLRRKLVAVVDVAISETEFNQGESGVKAYYLSQVLWH